jgi:hypothetical protein
MRNIAISAPYNFSSEITLFESLDSIITEQKNIKLIAPAIASLSNLIREYSDKNGFEYEFYIANWSKNTSADVERDKSLIANADELIVFDDGNSNKINLLKIWAKEKGIPVFSISIIPSNTVQYTDFLTKELSHITDKIEIRETIEEFAIAKEQAIKDAHYEVAAIIRDKIRILSIK